jgi:ABC-type phosphate transport system substrate-binding protein
MLGSLQAQLVIIAHRDVPVDQPTQPQLFDFYTGDIKRWENKHPVIVFRLQPRTAIQDSFFHLLGRTSSRMKSIWMKNMLSG